MVSGLIVLRYYVHDYNYYYVVTGSSFSDGPLISGCPNATTYELPQVVVAPSVVDTGISQSSRPNVTITSRTMMTQPQMSSMLDPTISPKYTGLPKVMMPVMSGIAGAAIFLCALTIVICRILVIRKEQKRSIPNTDNIELSNIRPIKHSSPLSPSGSNQCSPTQPISNTPNSNSELSQIRPTSGDQHSQLVSPSSPNLNSEHLSQIQSGSDDQLSQLVSPSEHTPSLSIDQSQIRPMSAGQLPQSQLHVISPSPNLNSDPLSQTHPTVPSTPPTHFPRPKSHQSPYPFSSGGMSHSNNNLLASPQLAPSLATSKSYPSQSVQQNILNPIKDYQVDSNDLMFLSSIQILACDYLGGKYTIDDHGIVLRIPKDAIAVGDNIEFEVGIAIHGPFKFPEVLKPISAMMWLSVSNTSSFTFKRQIEICFPYYLKLTKRDLCSDKLGFMMTDSETDGNDLVFKEKDRKQVVYHQAYATVSVESFSSCYLCLCAPESVIARRTQFSLTPVMPDPKESHQWQIHFCVSYDLPTFKKVRNCHWNNYVQYSVFLILCR